jgi:hypothetical protein
MVMIVLKTKRQFAQKFNLEMYLKIWFENEKGEKLFSPFSLILGLLGPTLTRAPFLSWVKARPTAPSSPLLSHRHTGPTCQIHPLPPTVLALPSRQ